ncbi:hypothetical protein FOZ62_029571, partial [Perkinsus olseni]
MLQILANLALLTTPLTRQACRPQGMIRRTFDSETGIRNMSYAPLEDGRLYVLPNFCDGIYVVYNGFLYKDDTPSRGAPAGTSYWACQRTRRRTATSPAISCASRLLIYGDVYDDSVELSLLKEVKEHTCGTRNADGHHLRISMDTFVCSGAASDKLTPRDIYDEFTTQASPQTLEQLPTMETCLEHIRRVMQKNNPRPPNPRHRTGFEIPLKYSKACFGPGPDGKLVEEDILYHDSGINDVNRCLIFLSPGLFTSITQGQASIDLSADGTFSSCCPLWGQQYSVLVRHRSSSAMCPSIFILMANRQKSSYEYVFRQLLPLFRGLRINSCIADFEHAAISEFCKAFGSLAVADSDVDSLITLCFFHFSKNVLKRFRKLRMFAHSERHLRSKRARCYYNILALAFLPVDLVPTALLTACQELDAPDYDYIVSYLSEWYVRPNALYPVKQWNQRRRVEAGRCRTTNCQEGWHRCWNAGTPPHPGVWRWIENVIRCLSQQRVKISNLDRGDRVRRKPYYEVTDAALYALIQVDVDANNLEDWFFVARGHMRRLTPPDASDGEAELEPFPFPWDEVPAPVRGSSARSRQADKGGPSQGSFQARRGSQISAPLMPFRARSSSNAAADTAGRSSHRSYPYAASSSSSQPLGPTATALVQSNTSAPRGAGGPDLSAPVHASSGSPDAAPSFPQCAPTSAQQPPDRGSNSDPPSPSVNMPPTTQQDEVVGDDTQ